jgi:hypothetical protein
MASYLDYLFPPQQQQPVPGLLGEEDIRRNQQMAQRAGLLNTGLGILAASAPSRMPQGNILQTLAPGLMAGQQAYQGTLAQQQSQLAERARALQEESVVLPEGGTLVGRRTGTTLAEGKPKPPPAPPGKIAEFEAAKERGFIDPNMTYQQFQMMSRPPGTNISVNMGEKNLFEIDKGVVENLTNQAVSARQFATSASQINNLLKGKGGGALVKVGAELAKNLGIDSETATANDLAKSLVTQTAVKVRPPGSGATSNIEFEAYISAVPSLANSEGGRNLMADANTRFATRAEKLADFSRDLYKKGQFNLTAVQEYDTKLGPVLPKTFYDQVDKRKPAQAPARGVRFLGFEPPATGN